MRRVGYYITISADGMYADPDGGLAEFGPDDEHHRFANGLVRDAGDAVMGRRMYDLMSYWDELDVDDPAVSDVEREFATFWRETPKHVASRGTPALRGSDDRIDGDVIDYVRRLRESDGPPILVGAGARLFAQLSEAGLIDDYRFAIAPMALGRGMALFASLHRPLHLRLTNQRTFRDGTVLLEYVAARPLNEPA
jgi:dihydrofolate reductase